MPQHLHHAVVRTQLIRVHPHAFTHQEWEVAHSPLRLHQIALEKLFHHFVQNAVQVNEKKTLVS